MTGSKSHSKLVAESGLEFGFDSRPLLAEFQPEAMLEASALPDPTSAWLAARPPAYPRTLLPIILLSATCSRVLSPFC